MPAPPTTKGRKIYKVNTASQALLIKLMLDGLHNTNTLADETGLSPVTIHRYCYELHRVGAAFIDHYEQDRLGRDQTKVYKIGVGVDAEVVVGQAELPERQLHDLLVDVAGAELVHLAVDQVLGEQHLGQDRHPVGRQGREQDDVGLGHDDVQGDVIGVEPLEAANHPGGVLDVAVVGLQQHREGVHG